MKTTWEVIKTKDLKEGIFIIIKYYNWDGKRHYSLGKIIQVHKNSFIIQEIGISKKDMSESEILHRFPTFNSTKRRGITKDGKYISPTREIIEIFKIDPIILKNIGQKIISEEKKEITKAKKALLLIKRKRRASEARMKSLGL